MHCCEVVCCFACFGNGKQFRSKFKIAESSGVKVAFDAVDRSDNLSLCASQGAHTLAAR